MNGVPIILRTLLNSNMVRLSQTACYPHATFVGYTFPRQSYK